jgi:cytochrome c biogenesis protein CcdA
MTSLIIVSFVAGLLTVLAPCILPLLPVVLVGTTNGTSKTAKVSTIIFGLTASVIIFSLLLKATTALLGVPQQFWQVASGVLLTLFGITMLFPGLWERLAAPLSTRAGKSLQVASGQRSRWGDLLLGAALGPVFNSCSPTYALIVAVILPTSFTQGLLYLFLYALGLATALSLIALLGRSIVLKLGWAADPRGWFHKTIGLLLIIAGVAVVFGLDKSVQTFVLENGWYDPILRLEQRFDLRN